MTNLQYFLVTIFGCIIFWFFSFGVKINKKSDDLFVITDPITKCDYLENSTRTAITPRLRPNGTQMCEVNHE